MLYVSEISENITHREKSYSIFRSEKKDNFCYTGPYVWDIYLGLPSLAKLVT